jgi:hypothetical protein
MRFELYHHSIRNRKDKNSLPIDTFSTRLVQLRIVIPPAGNPVTPRKRKPQPSDGFFGSFTPQKGFKRGDNGSDKENCGGPIKRPRFE